MCNRRAQQPLNPAAVQAANQSVWNSYPELGGRKLTLEPADQKYRKAWMDAYVAAGGKVDKGEPKAPVNNVKAPCKSPKCTLTSQTIATSPVDRSRKTLGVGEEVTLTYSPGSANWSNSGNGKLSAVSGATIKFTGGETAGSDTITASGTGGSCVITFTVIAPSSMTMKRRTGTNLKHTVDRPDCGWQGTIYLHPNNVNFYRVEIREKDSQAVTTGSYTPFNGVYHGNYAAPDRVSHWLPMKDHNILKGTSLGNTMWDNIYSGDPGSANTNDAPPFKVGTMYFPITWQWRVVASANVHDFPSFRQEHQISSDGKCKSSKAGNSEETKHTDPTSTP